MRRRLPAIAIFLLAGAVVNVGVAWGCARWSRSLEMIFGQLFSGESPASTESTSTPSAWRLDNVPERWPDKPKFEETGRTRWFLLTTQISRLDDKFSSVVLLEQRIGAPTKSLARYRIGEKESGTWTFSWRHAWGRDYPLPLRPIWPGFAANTIFYATIFWLVIPGPFALCRLIRQRRGLCPSCAYPMGESAVCSECGKELPKRVRPAT